MSEHPLTSLVFTARVETELGLMFLAATELGLCLLVWDEARFESELDTWLGRHARKAELRCDEARLAPVAAQLQAYARGELQVFELTLDLRGTAFQKKVWEALSTIPFGQTRTYAQLAQQIGHPRSFRAVGGANGSNPVPIIVPCHRVLARNGLGGFGYGLDCKRRLLELEAGLSRTEKADFFESPIPTSPRNPVSLNGSR